jgi:hypothetical protein
MVMKYILLLFVAAISYSVSFSQAWVRVNEVRDTAVYCIEQHNNTLYVGTSDRVYITVNNGASWTSTAHISTSPVVTVTVFKNKLYVGTFGSGVFQSSDNGAHWQPVSTGLGVFQISKFAIWNNNLYAATYGNGMYKLNDAGNGWLEFNNEFFTNVDGNVFDLESTGTTLIAAAGANSFFYKLDTVQKKWNSFTYFPFTRPGFFVFGLMMDGPTLYAASQDFLLRSSDTGSTWVFDRTGMLAGELLITAGNTNDYVAGNSFDGSINKVRVYQRARGAAVGAAWTKTDSLFDNFFSAFAFSNGRLYAAQDSGLYYKQVEAGTVTAVPNVINHIEQIRVFPNPSKGMSNIHFELTQQKKISVQLLDITGKLIDEPYHDLNLNTGQQDLLIDLSRLQSAVYLIRVISEKEQFVTRVVVSR